MYNQGISAAVITAALIIFSFKIAYADDFNLITTISGDSIGDNFFHIANGHGDVNGDGFEDLLIGAPQDYGGMPDGGGYARLFFGGIPFDTIPDLEFQMEGSGTFGISCAFAGDVNNDGYDDILIGDPSLTTNYWDDGAAYLYFGGENMDTVPDMTFIGEYYYHMLGGNVSGAGDVNGDGIDDWLINAPNDAEWAQGFIYLYYGGEDPDTICDVFFEGDIEEVLCFDNPALGDVNGDGCDDLLFLKQGIFSAEIHLGSAVMDTIEDLIWTGHYPPIYYCTPVCGVGDVNNDGFNDWWIRGTDGHSLYFGSIHPDTIPDLLFEPEPPCNWLNDQAAGGDIDGDGIDDIVIGGYMGSGFGGYGQILGYSGGSNFNNNYDYFYDSGIEYEWLGRDIGLADINGDSIFEVIARGEGEGRGRIWILTTQEVGVEANEPEVLGAFELLPNYPNPFNASTTISFCLERALPVKIIIYNQLGHEVITLIDEKLNPGMHQLNWNANTMSSGVYLIQLETPEFSKNQKAILVK